MPSTTSCLAPAITAAGLAPHRADADRRGGSIHLDMFQDLLLAEFVVADLTIDNPNVWYEIGVRHALRAGGAVLTYALRDRLPFDIAGQRMQRYTLKEGKLDPDLVEAERTALDGGDRSDARRLARKARQPGLPAAPEPQRARLEDPQGRRRQRVLAGARSVAKPRRGGAAASSGPATSWCSPRKPRTACSNSRHCARRHDALLKLNRPRYALSVIERARQLDPDDVKARQIEAIALGRAERYAEARETLRRLAEEHKGRGDPGPLRAHLEGRVDADLERASAAQGSTRSPRRATPPATLQSAASAYVEAFRAAPGDHYPGINALTLGRLWEHVTGRTEQAAARR